MPGLACVQCGKPIAEGARFCGSCGAPGADEAPPPTLDSPTVAVTRPDLAATQLGSSSLPDAPVAGDKQTVVGLVAPSPAPPAAEAKPALRGHATVIGMMAPALPPAAAAPAGRSGFGARTMIGGSALDATVLAGAPAPAPAPRRPRGRRPSSAAP